jgi:hypothetical protein
MVVTSVPGLAATVTDFFFFGKKDPEAAALNLFISVYNNDFRSNINIKTFSPLLLIKTLAHLF